MRFSATIVSLILIALTSTAFSAEAEQPRTVSTNGEAIVYVVPDEVIVNFGVEVANPALDEAKRENDKLCQRLVKAVKDFGIEDKHVQSDHMEVELRYESHDSLKIKGYVTRRGYCVTLKDPKKFEQFIDLVLRNGANRLLGFEYRTTELRKYRDQARAMAINAAKEKAVALTSELRVGVGLPRTINEGHGYYGYWGARWGWNSMNAQSQVQSQSGGASEGGDTMPMGQIGVRANVSVTFDLAIK